MLRTMYQAYPALGNVLLEAVMKEYQINLDDLPPAEDEDNCRVFAVRLCRDSFLRNRSTPIFFVDFTDEESEASSDEDELRGDVDVPSVAVPSTISVRADDSDLVGLLPGALIPRLLTMAVGRNWPRDAVASDSGGRTRSSWPTPPPFLDDFVHGLLIVLAVPTRYISYT